MGNIIPNGTTVVQVNSCNIYEDFRRNRNSSTFLGGSRYEGIPQNLILNLCGWLLLHGLFIVLRKKAWNYGRVAVMQKEEIKWTDMFYAGYHDDDLSINSGGGNNFSSGGRAPVIIASAISSRHARKSEIAAANLLQQEKEQSVSPVAGDIPSQTESKLRASGEFTVTSEQDKAIEVDLENGNYAKEDNPHLNNTSSYNQNMYISEIRDTGYFSWIKIVYNLTDEQYREKCGQDCVFYLSFQRHLIFLASVITVFSLTIALPINLHNSFNEKERKNYERSGAEFTDTTIVNLHREHDFLWAHILLSIAYLVIAIVVMRHYSKRLQFMEVHEETSRTVCIIGIRRRNCREDLLRAHFAETYPMSEITEVSFAYNVSKLQRYSFRKLSASSAKIYFQEMYERHLAKARMKEPTPPTQARPQMRPYLCGIFGCRCSECCGECCQETDAIDYYTELEKRSTQAEELQRQWAINHPLGIAFVTFTTFDGAERLVEDYTCSTRLFLHTPVSKASDKLNSNRWIVKYAPPPEEINWHNLTLDFKMWYVKFVAVNLVLAMLVIIFTTPVYLFAWVKGNLPSHFQLNLSDTNARAQAEALMGRESDDTLPTIFSAIANTLPTLILWILGHVLIALVSHSDVIIGFWTKTAGNLSEMIKIFFFLTFMVIVMPALGITSFIYFLREVTNAEVKIPWDCIFYRDNGALVVNYICTSSLIGTAAELMRIPELFLYVVKLSLARSRAEIGSIRRSVLWDFQIGAHYAWTMLHFALFTCFSVIYPLVTPFGLLYLLLKHWTDRYNIYFAYSPCKVNKEVHGTAINFVIMCVFMLQINLLAYVHFYLPDRKHTGHQEVKALQIFSLLGFSVTAVSGTALLQRVHRLQSYSSLQEFS